MTFRIKRNKFKVSPAEDRTLNGVLYASKAEMWRAAELWKMYDEGILAQIIEQPLVRLGIADNKYRPDFFVVSSDRRFWYEDVKGMETQAFRRNVALWKKYGPASLMILKRSGKGWAEKVEIKGAE